MYCRYITFISHRMMSSLQPPRVLIKSIYLDTTRSTYAAVDICGYSCGYMYVYVCAWRCMCVYVYVCVCM